MSDNADELRRDLIMERKFGRNWQIEREYQEWAEQERDNFELEDERE